MELAFGYADQFLIFVVFAVALNLLLGYTGQISVAHAAFGAVGGYTLAYLSLHSHIPALECIALGTAFAGFAGLFVGIPALRLKAEWLILLTLAVQIVINLFVATSRPLGGTYGLQDVTGLSLFGRALVNPSDMFLPFLACTALALLVCWRMGESPYGRVLRAIREDETACRAVGKAVFRYKLTAFTTSAALAGLAGSLLVIEAQIAAPKQFLFDQSAAIVATVVVGGSGSLFGPVVGVLLLSLLGPLFERVLAFNADVAFTWRLVAYGAALVAVVALRPGGLLPDAMTRRLNASQRRARRLPLDEPASPSANGNRFAGSIAALPHPRERGETVLVVEGISKHFGGIRAVENLSLELRSHSITALVGPNGAGKTTVFNLLTGALRPDAGRVLLRGRDVVGMTPDRIALLGMVRSFQDVRAFPRLSALENVMLAIRDQPGERLVPLFASPRRVARMERECEARAREWLGFVGMDRHANVPAGVLAFGQQKLVALARVLATEADVVLLDEPASGIDVQWVDVMLELIGRIRARGRTVCLVEHNLHVVERLADRTYFMEAGTITAHGSFAELTADRRLAQAYFGTA